MMSLRVGNGATALLDAMPDNTAVVAPDGTIVAVNRAWRMFAIDNGGSNENTGVGTNYIDVCARAAATGCRDASAVDVGLRAVLAGETVECDLEYPCPSTTFERWFVLRITPLGCPRSGVLVSHFNISRRKMAERNLERKATEDPLTGLANRVLFSERLTSALAARPGRQAMADVGLLYLDLDSFKAVNDTYGHAAGDEVLQAVAGRLGAQVRPQDTVARLGGDEFAILTPRTNPKDVATLVARITQALNLPHPIYGKQLEVRASVGSYLAGHGETAPEALGHADRAMYAVKALHAPSR